MTFTKAGPDVVRQCQDCGYCSTERHLADGHCPLCHGETTTVDTVEDTGMSSFQYRGILDSLDDVSGVGSATRNRIDDAFSGDEFIDACEDGYRNNDFDKLTEISGIGEQTAKNIVFAIADRRDWSGGLAEVFR